MIYESILDTIGNTPVVKLQRIAPKHVTIYVKIEAFNPLGSVKDRLALAIIDDAERRGLIEPGQTVIEATSGNTGIALAMVCAAKGYPFVATMVETFSVERRKIMRALGAKVILTPAAERGSGMVRLAQALADKHGWFLARQFENPANPAFHRQTTGPEILRDFAGRRLDYLGHGLGYRRNADRRRRDAQARSPRGHDRGDRARRRVPARGQGMGAPQDSRLDSGFPARRSEPEGVRSALTRDGRGRQGDGAAPRARGRDLRRHLGRRDPGGRDEGGRDGRKLAPCCSRCCPTRANGISARICSTT